MADAALPKSCKRYDSSARRDRHNLGVTGCVCDGCRVVEPSRRGSLAETTSVAGRRPMPRWMNC